VPTDYYYADLTGNWDRDGDGYYGERDHDQADFNPEIWVGRIPIDDSGLVEKICLKIINYEQNDDSWKKEVLSCGAIHNYENEDNSGYDKTDGAELMNEIWYDIYINNDFDRTTMFETEGLSPSQYNCDYSLNHENILSIWPNGFGIVNLDGHGNSKEVFRKVWSEDDGDNIPEDFEIDWSDYFTSNDIDELNDTFPSIVFSVGCGNGNPYSDKNMGVFLLNNGAIIFIGATATNYYTVGWKDESDGGNQAIEYYFFKYLISNDQSCGNALYNSKLYFINNFDWWGWHIYQNMYAFCLYGDPSISFDTFPNGSPPTKPIKPSGIEEGRPKISYSFSTSCDDPDNDEILYKWDWGDGSFSDWIGPFQSGEVVFIDHKWDNDGQFPVRVLAVDEIGSQSEWSDSLKVNIVNNAPNKPIVDGPLEIDAKKIITYVSSTIDMDDDNIYFMFSWGDGDITGWLGPFESGYEIASSHSWEYPGEYNLKVKAKDIYDFESEWSDPLRINVPRSKTLSVNIFLRLYNLFSNFFPKLKYLYI
jgi:hypothetical protein